MNFLGFTITRSKPKDENISFAPKIAGDAINIDAIDSYVSKAVLDLNDTFKSDDELIRKYRELALYPEVDSGIQEIVSEAVSEDIAGDVIELDLSKVPEDLLPESTHESLQEAFSGMMSTMGLRNNCAEYFRKWYTEGRLNFHAIIDGDNPKRGILEYRYLDPLNIKKVVESEKIMHPETGVLLYTKNKEYYIFSEKGLNGAANGTKIAADTIVSSTSGLVDGARNLTISYLHKALRPSNQLKMIEDACLIYFMTRSPERRVFEIPVGQMATEKATQHVENIMNSYRNKMTYDSATGEQKGAKRFFSMLEDFFIPTRSDGSSVKITPLTGGTQLTQQLEIINYFKQKLYKALNIPVSRLDSGNQFNLGRATEITRDEVKFSKFIESLRRQFASTIFMQALRLESILRGIITLEDWEKIEEFIVIRFASDNHFNELKELEVLDARLAIMDKIKNLDGKFFSERKIAMQVLGMTEDEYLEEQEQIRKEKLNNPEPENDKENSFGGGSDFGGGGFGGNDFGDDTPNIDTTPSDEEEDGEDQNTNSNVIEPDEEQEQEPLRG